MKHTFLSLALASVVSLTVSGIMIEPVEAQNAVVCTNCGTEWTQLMNKAMMAKQLATQAQQLSTQINQYKDMLTNSNGVSTHVWGKARQDFNRLTQLMGQSRSLAYSAGNLDNQFATRYGTYQSYQRQKMGTADWQNKYQQWTKEGQDNALYALKGLGMQAAQMQDEQMAMQRLQAMSQSAQGRMEALQIANMMAAQNVEQVQKLRQLMMMQLQMQANYIAQQQDKDAARQVAREKFYRTWKPINYKDGKGF